MDTYLNILAAIHGVLEILAPTDRHRLSAHRAFVMSLAGPGVASFPSHGLLGSASEDDLLSAFFIQLCTRALFCTS